MDQNLIKSYSHLNTEKEWSRRWEESRVFEIDGSSEKIPFSIMLPPPDLMDSGHFGNLLSLCLADIIIRRKVMQGFNAFWPPEPGFFGMAMFLKQFGLSRAWTKLVPGSSPEMQKALRKAFIQLYREGKIYGNMENRDHRRGRRKGIKPVLSQEWFLRAGDLVEPALAAVENNRIVIVPEKWKSFFLSLLKNVRDYRICRRGTEGQRIPAFHCRSCSAVVVSEEPPVACGECHSQQLVQDENILDGGFVWALEQVVRLSRQDEHSDFRFFYPASLMVTGFYFPFHLIVQMILMALHLGHDVPFHEVLINGLVFGRNDRKMSRVSGESISAAALISEYGADVLRFALAVQAVPGISITLPLSRIRGCKAFANKVWNASRYVLLTQKEGEGDQIDFDRITDSDRWILHLLNMTMSKVNELFDSCRFREAADLLYHFFRDEYCDWYLEFSKADAGQPETRKALAFTLVRILRLLHPFMPFITEEIYHRIRPGCNFLLRTDFPEFDSHLVFKKAFVQVEFLKKLIIETRKTRSGNQIHPQRWIAVYLKAASPGQQAELQPNLRYFNLLTRSKRTELVADFSGLGKGFRCEWQNWEILLPFENEEEWKKQVRKLEEDRREIAERISALENQISGTGFSGEVLQHLKKRLLEANGKKRKLEKTLAGLS